MPTSKYHHLPHQSSCQTSIQESAFFLEAILRKYCQTQKSKHTLNYFVVFKEKQKNWKHLECTYLGSVLKDIYIGIRYSARYLGGPRYILMRVYKYVYKYIHTLQLPFETKQELWRENMGKEHTNIHYNDFFLFSFKKCLRKTYFR